ncbi:hypothetical protein [Gracilibacillus kekensis]|uniref:Uncharacterized protein n=1 Tax=Gracilibacillus kekensis TaxID=1027249 RepID=A0A1M7QP18_9BACI|nr:hypothetical protein [Gracilibacillus kekensis]SHN32922.1 hypothetical protein SAMN05216179_3378 [Gracilibacillus kekensis]
MPIFIIIIIMVFVIYRNIVHGLETLKEGNKTGSIAIFSVIPFVLFIFLCFYLWK